MPSIRLPVYMNEPARFEARVEILDAPDNYTAPTAFGISDAQIRRIKREACLEQDSIKLKPPQNQGPPRPTARGLLMKMTPWFDSLRRKGRS